MDKSQAIIRSQTVGRLLVQILAGLGLKNPYR
jgi:hypothetical protein